MFALVLGMGLVVGAMSRIPVLDTQPGGDPLPEVDPFAPVLPGIQVGPLSTENHVTSNNSAGEYPSPPEGLPPDPVVNLLQPAGPTDASPTLVLGGVDLRWEEFQQEDYPTLSSLLNRALAGNLLVRPVAWKDCPANGWFTLSSGSPVNLGQCSAAQVEPAVPGRPAHINNWADLNNQFNRTGTHLGNFGDLVYARNLRAAAFGPGAALMLANTLGEVRARYVSPADASSLPEPLSTQIVESCRENTLTVVDLASLLAPSTPGRPPRAPSPHQQLKVISQVLASFEAEQFNPQIIVAGLASSQLPADTQLVLMRSPNLQPGLARTGTVRQPGIVQTIDLAATALSSLDLGPSQNFRGAPMKFSGAPQTDPGQLLGQLLSRSAHARASADSLILYLGIFLFGTAGIVLFTIFRSRRPAQLPNPARQALRFAAGTWALSLPGSMLANLVGWWWLPGAHLVGAVVPYLVGAVLMAGVEWLRRGLDWQPLLTISLVTFLTICIDTVAGSPLALNSPIGYQVLNGFRFYGVGNHMFALLITALLVLMSYLLPFLENHRVSRSFRLGVFAVIAAVAVAINGLPMWGADFGGPLAAIPALIIFALLACNARVSRLKAAGTALVTVAFAVVVAIFDWHRPDVERTHLGRFAQSVADGEALQVIGRKLTQIFTLWGPAWLVALGIVIGVALHVLVFLPVYRAYKDPEDRDYLWLSVASSHVDAGTVLSTRLDIADAELDRSGWERLLYPWSYRPFRISWLTAMIIATLVNDSSVAIFATGLYFLSLLVIANLPAPAAPVSPAAPVEEAEHV